MKLQWIDVNWWFCTLHWATLSHCRVAWWSYWRCVSPASLLAATDRQRRQVEGATATTRRSSTHGVEQRRTSCKGQQDSHPEVRFMSYVQSFPLVFPYWFRWSHMILQCSTHFMSIFTSRIFIKWSQNLEANLSITTRPPLWQRTLQTLGLS